MSYYEQSAKPSISGLGAVGIQQAAAGLGDASSYVAFPEKQSASFMAFLAGRSAVVSASSKHAATFVVPGTSKQEVPALTWVNAQLSQGLMIVLPSATAMKAVREGYPVQASTTVAFVKRGTFCYPGAMAIPGQGPMWGLGDLIYNDGTVFWRVKDASETLSSIAVKVYGSVTVQKDIWNANPQGRVQSGAKFGDQKWGWYNVGTLLKLPKVSGYPDPYDAAKKAGLVTAQEGETIVLPDGTTATIGSGGQISKAGMGLYVGLAAAAVGVMAVVYFSKKKKGQSKAMVKTT